MERSTTKIIETIHNRGYMSDGMMESTPGQRIRQAREQRGWSQANLAQKVGISQPAIKKIEDGDTVRSRFLHRISALLDIPYAELDPNPVPAQGMILPKERILLPTQDFPVYAAAEGGPGEIIISSDPIAFLPRPAPLMHVKSAYGLNVTGTSMEPEFFSGETALVNPLLPIVAGEAYVFYAEQEGEARAALKRLRRATPEEWLVTQHNPPPRKPKDFSLPRREWRWSHRIIGKFSRQ